MIPAFDARAMARALFHAQRIAVIGSPGAGKSTVSSSLAKLLGLPVHHLDRLFWLPGWRPTPAEAWEALQEELVAAPRWVIDGNYGGTLGIRIGRADAVVFLDMPGMLCLWRIVRRGVLGHGQVRPDMADGCPEQLDWEFIAWTASFRRRSRPAILALASPAPPGQVWIAPTRPAEVRSLMYAVEEVARAGEPYGPAGTQGVCKPGNPSASTVETTSSGREKRC